MNPIPIVFGWSHQIQSNGFLASVDSRGGALVHLEEDGTYWLEGVFPGGLSGTGLDRAQAIEDFRHGYTAALFDIAQEANSFDQFKAEVEEFFNGASEYVHTEWTDARQKVREGKLKDSVLNRTQTDFQPKIGIRLVQKISPKNNRLDEDVRLAS